MSAIGDRGRSAVVYWMTKGENGGKAVMSSPPITSPAQAIKVAQGLMVRKGGPKVLWAEVRRLGVVLYRTTQEEWE